MPVIAVISPKGGVGKTTSSIILACQLARQTDVVLIDADENRPVKAWAALGTPPERLSVRSEGITEDTIVDMIEAAAEDAAFVVVDCEGTANLTVAYAVGAADLVIVPMGGSALDANQAARGLRLVKQAEKNGRRKIPHAVLLTRTPAAVRSRTLTGIHSNLRQHGVAMFDTELHERDAFRALFSFGGSLDTLDPTLVGGLDKARLNARAFAAEAVAMMKGRGCTLVLAPGGRVMATAQRVDPFATIEEDLDLSGIAPSPRSKPKADKAETKASAANLGFKSREALTPVPAEAATTSARASRRAKSTKEQFNLRAERADIERLCEIAAERKWLLGDAFGEAVAALAEKLAS